eukprot:NODE_3588_length_766_cov_299.504923.p4 GENE.NODE_3588_length_766_cov_299.504923~~NODE_3588_length_766_cov_299.504923.p4  ORF type:complete len:96 (-),score=19.23 NODE_3588_length_766_cov_299.504923:372-659(-)
MLYAIWGLLEWMWLPTLISVDSETAVPEDVYLSFYEAGARARERGQHVVWERLDPGSTTPKMHLMSCRLSEGDCVPARAEDAEPAPAPLACFPVV